MPVRFMYGTGPCCQHRPVRLERAQGIIHTTDHVLCVCYTPVACCMLFSVESVTSYASACCWTLVSHMWDAACPCHSKHCLTGIFHCTPSKGTLWHFNGAGRPHSRRSAGCCNHTSSLPVVSIVSTPVREKEQLQQQIQQLSLSVAASNGHDVNDYQSAANHSTDTANLGLLQTSAESSPHRQASRPASVTNVLIIEVFAGSFSAGRLAARLNSSNTGIRVSGYAAVELDPAHISRAADSSVYGMPDHEECSLLINGSITDHAVHGRLMQFVQRLLQQSADGSGPVIDGVMLLGGPPCTMYSACMTYLLPKVIEPNPDAFR